MVRVTYIEHTGTEHHVDVTQGNSLMEGAVKNGVRGIVAQCGGACSCATCQVYIEGEWKERVGSPKSTEVDMLECAFEPNENSRLSCQIIVDDSMNGLVVKIPERQE